MANLLTSIFSGVGTVAKGVGSAAAGLGKGALSGAGEAAGLGQIFKPAVSEFTKNVTARGAAGAYNLPSTTPSLWNKVGSTLGKQAVTGGGGTPSSPAISPPSYGTSVTQGKPYQGAKKGENYDTLLQRLEELARR